VPKHFREKHELPTTSYTCAGACKETKECEWRYLHKANILRVDAKTLPACVEPVLADHTVTVPTHPAAMHSKTQTTCIYTPL